MSLSQTRRGSRPAFSRRKLTIQLFPILDSEFRGDASATANKVPFIFPRFNFRCSMSKFIPRARTLPLCPSSQLLRVLPNARMYVRVIPGIRRAFTIYTWAWIMKYTKNDMKSLSFTFLIFSNLHATLFLSRALVFGTFVGTNIYSRRTRTLCGKSYINA